MQICCFEDVNITSHEESPKIVYSFAWIHLNQLLQDSRDKLHGENRQIHDGVVRHFRKVFCSGWYLFWIVAIVEHTIWPTTIWSRTYFTAPPAPNANSDPSDGPWLFGRNRWCRGQHTSHCEWAHHRQNHMIHIESDLSYSRFRFTTLRIRTHNYAGLQPL